MFISKAGEKIVYSLEHVDMAKVAIDGSRFSVFQKNNYFFKGD